MWHSEKDRKKIHKVVQHKIRSILYLLYPVRQKRVMIKRSMARKRARG